MKKNVFSLHGQNIVDLIKENVPNRPPPPANPAPSGPWVQGNHNIVIGGNLLVHVHSAKKDEAACGATST